MIVEVQPADLGSVFLVGRHGVRVNVPRGGCMRFERIDQSRVEGLVVSQHGDVLSRHVFDEDVRP